MTEQKQVITISERSLSISNANIGFRNFEGRATTYNMEGNRNFAVFLDKDSADALKDEGYNVKQREAVDPEDEPWYFMSVSVSYKVRPPQIILVTSNGKTLLDESTLSLLDWADIKTVDLVINPYHWEVSGKSGIKAYAKKMFVVIEEDEFDRKYFGIPDTEQIPFSVTDDDTTF